MATSANINRVLYITASATTTIQSYDSQWARAHDTSGMTSLTGYPMTGTLTPAASDAGGGANYAINRSVIWLDTPQLFGDIDGPVVLRLRGSGSSGITIVKCNLTSSEPITATDGTSGYTPDVWSSINTAILFSTEASSSLEQPGRYTYITLNHEAKKWILSGSKTHRSIRQGVAHGYGFALGIINYKYDYLNAAPADGTTHGAFLDTTGTIPPYGPSNVINGVWLTGSRGAEPTYTKDNYVIIPYDNDITRYPRRISQTPYGLSIKGPSSLRKKNVPYKVTT